VERPLDVEEIAGAIRQALSAERNVTLGQAVQERQRSHSWERFVSDWDQRYTKLVAGR
jgi:hypothetical protein